jgi:hypothetical protein
MLKNEYKIGNKKIEFDKDEDGYTLVVNNHIASDIIIKIFKDKKELLETYATIDDAGFIIFETEEKAEIFIMLLKLMET